MHKQKPLRITKGNNSHRIGPLPLYFFTNVYLEDINVFARFYEIPSLPVENIKEKPKRHGWTERWMDGHLSVTVYHPSPSNCAGMGRGGIIKLFSLYLTLIFTSIIFKFICGQKSCIFPILSQLAKCVDNINSYQNANGTTMIS